ncbi:hypothetical protein RUM43_002111 [Polyplax serrata]|uniref:Uncharacterized protein n=1 Tax=Polyplax serrata TaxID=468196 RepID=A0AAN8S5R9_POLSC
MNPNEIDQSTFILSDRIIAVISVTRTSLEQLTSRQDEDDFHAREAIKEGVMLRGTTGDRHSTGQFIGVDGSTRDLDRILLFVEQTITNGAIVWFVAVEPIV